MSVRPTGLLTLRLKHFSLPSCFSANSKPSWRGSVLCSTAKRGCGRWTQAWDLAGSAGWLLFRGCRHRSQPPGEGTRTSLPTHRSGARLLPCPESCRNDWEGSRKVVPRGDLHPTGAYGTSSFKGCKHQAKKWPRERAWNFQPL